jgi:ferrochelatase
MSVPYVPTQRKTKVVFVQLGSPEEPTTDALRKYLREFLRDPRVIDLNPIAWQFILNALVLPFRPKKSAALYARIWDAENRSFPLITNTEGFAEGVSKALTSFDPDGKVEVNHAFLLSQPRVSDVYDRWEEDLARNQGASKLIVVPMFPQYSESTTASGVDALAKELGKRVKIPTFEVITNFHRTHAFIDNSVRKIDEKLQRLKAAGTDPQHLVLSFHGMQKRRVIYKGDAYYRHCFETYKLITDRLKHIATEDTVMTFQSRFGSEEWITPYTDDVVQSLIESGKKEIVVYSASFIADCLETTDELGTELVNEAKEWGGNVHTVDCLNMDAQWCEDFARYTFTQAEGSAQDKEDLEYKLSADDYAHMPTLRMTEKEPVIRVDWSSLQARLTKAQNRLTDEMCLDLPWSQDSPNEKFEQLEQPEQIKQSEQLEQPELPEQPEQPEQPEHPEQLEKLEQLEQPLRKEILEQLEKQFEQMK